MCETLRSSSSSDVRNKCPITHVIFDLDGTLIDTELWGLNNLNAMLTTYGKSCSPDIYSKYIGLDPLERSKRIIKDFELDYDNQKFLNDWIQKCLQSLTTINLMPGVRQLVNHLRAHNIPMAIGTAGKKAEFYAKTAHMQDLFGDGIYFTHVVHGDDKRIQRPKPNPDLFELCGSLFESTPDPQNVVVFEDNLVGITAAVSAGMRSVLVNDNRFFNFTDNTNADIVINGLQDFRPQCIGLPPFPSL